MKKHKVLQITLLIVTAFVCFACDADPGWEEAKKGVELEIATKKLSLDLENCRMMGLLQEGMLPDAATTGYSLHFLNGYGRTITIHIEPEGDGWGVTFEPLTLTFARDDSGISFQGESEKGYVFVPAGSQPARNGTMPLTISVKDQQGEVLVSHKATTFVYDKEKTLNTIGEMNNSWKLDIGNALFYVPSQADAEARYEENKLIVYGAFGSNQVDNFENTGLTACKVEKGSAITNLLQLDKYIAVDDVTGIYWQSAYNPFNDVAHTWAQIEGVAQIYDYVTGDEITQTSTFRATVNGVQAKSINNEQANSGASWNTCVLDGKGDERLIDIRTTTATWYIGARTPATFDREGTYILQWELLNKRPGSNASTALQVIGKLRVIVQVVEIL